ncbi:MAG: VOC family protein [Alphaproteobacteria bacterium]|jgi:uncharacterized glyoxalase superfamily protein PhnB|nr:VOC family protein [Alphaproteobacteria bacterium]
MKFIPSISAKNAIEAIDLYINAFKGEAANVHYNTEMPGCDSSAANFKKAIMHAEVRVKGETILHLTEAMEVATEHYPATTYGDNMSVSVVFEDVAELTESYNKLKDSQGATVLMPLAEQFFGTFGMVKDRFNVIWALVKTNDSHK